MMSLTNNQEKIEMISATTLTINENFLFEQTATPTVPIVQPLVVLDQQEYDQLPKDQLDEVEEEIESKSDISSEVNAHEAAVQHADEQTPKKPKSGVWILTVLVSIVVLLISVLLTKQLFKSPPVTNPYSRMIPQHVHKQTTNLNDGKKNLQLDVHIPINNTLKTNLHFSVQVNDPVYLKLFNFTTFNLKHISNDSCFQDYLGIVNHVYREKEEFMVNYTIPIRDTSIENHCFQYNLSRLNESLKFELQVQDLKGINHKFEFKLPIKANFFMGFFGKELRNLAQPIIRVFSIGQSGSAKSHGIVEFFLFRDISNTPEVIINLHAKHIFRHDTVNITSYNMSRVVKGNEDYQFSFPFEFVDHMGFLNVTDFDTLALKGQLPQGQDLVKLCLNNNSCLAPFKENPVNPPDIVLFYASPRSIETESSEIIRRLDLIHGLGLPCILMIPSGKTKQRVDIDELGVKYAHVIYLDHYFQMDTPSSVNNPNLYTRNADLFMKMLRLVNGKAAGKTSNNPNKL